MRKVALLIPSFFILYYAHSATLSSCFGALSKDRAISTNAVETVAKPNLNQRLKKLFHLTGEGDTVFFNGLLVQATKRSTLQSEKILILSDYVGSQHRVLLDKLSRKGFAVEALNWGGELALTLQDSRVAVSALNSCSGLIHGAMIPLFEANPLKYRLLGYPDVSNMSEELVINFLSTSFPELINDNTQVFPYSVQQEHLMKVEGVGSFDPKHIDVIQGLTHLLLLHTPTSVEAVRRMIDVVEIGNLFTFFDSIIKNLLVTKNGTEEWTQNIIIYNEFKYNILLFNDAETPHDVISFLTNIASWVNFIEAVQSISQRAYKNPDTRFIILSVTDSGTAPIF